jgi:hypothetical protein
LVCAVLLPLPVLAETYPPSKSSKYLCSQAGVTTANPNGVISVRLKAKGKKIAGKVNWNFTTLDKTLKKVGKSKKSADKKIAKELKAVLKVLLVCYDKRFVPRPGVTPVPTPTADPVGDPVGFDAVRPILEQNCMGCHAATGWQLTQAYFLDHDMIEPGIPGLSMLYRRLRNNPEGYSPGSMPPSGAGLSAADISIIRNWIVGLAEPPTPGSTPVPTPPPGHFGCIQNTEIASSKMKRLSKEQLYNSLTDLLTIGSINRATALNIAGTYEWSEWRGIPEDYSSLGHARLDDRLDESYLEAALVAFEGVVTRLENMGRLDDLVQAYVPTCNASTYQSESCRNQFLQRFARRSFRIALSAADYDFYRRPNSSGQTQASLRDILLALLSAPRFLYHFEDAGTPTDANGLVVRISPREYISRLAYTLWNTIPDEQLVQFAETGVVDQNPAAVVDYALTQQAAKSREGLKDFFDGWFKVHHSLAELGQYMEVDSDNQRLLQVNYGGGELPLLTDFSNSSTVANAMRSYKDAAAEEILNLGAILSVDTAAPVSELFRTRLAPVTNDMLRRNYNLPGPWNGDYQNIPLAPVTHSGILSRVSFHLSRGQRGRLIIKGRRIRDQILCDTTGLPTNNANPPGTQTNSFSYITGTTQNRVRTITEQVGTQCASCHVQYINPLGNLLEEFDPNGRRRSGGQEVVYEVPPGSQNLTEFRNSFDTTVAPYVNRQDSSSVTGVAGLSERIATSPEMHACYTRNLVRFAFNRIESDAWDGCFMNEILANAQSTSMKEVLRRLFLHPSYRLRRLNETYIP